MKRDNFTRATFLSTGVLTLLIGYLYYLLTRDPESTFIGIFSQSIPFFQHLPSVSLHGYFFDSLPSLIYVVSFSLICIGIWGISARRVFFIPLLWFFISFVFEMGQKYFIQGTFDQNDISAAFIGYVIVVTIIAITRRFFKTEHNKLTELKYSTITTLKVLVAFAGFFCLVATSPPCTGGTCDPCQFLPIYLSNENLREPIIPEEATAINQLGKIYVYGQLILVNEPNKGIHVIDNTDPSNPVNLKYLAVPGNLDMAVRDNILYVDSYIDLVAFDISDLDNIQEINRIEDVFPYDPYQNVPDDVIFSIIDEAEGVIVDYLEECND